MTSVTAPLDRIRPGRAVLIVIASLLLGLGWVACKLCAMAAAWLAAARRVLAWCGSAVIEGWQSAKAGQRAP